MDLGCSLAIHYPGTQEIKFSTSKPDRDQDDGTDGKQILAGVSGNKSIQETLDKMETAATDAL